MKKLFLLFVLAVVSTGTVLADNISVQQALQTARQFATAPSIRQPMEQREQSEESRASFDSAESRRRKSEAQLSKRKAPTAVTPTLAHSMKSKVAVGKDNVYVINLGNDQGFVVVSGESGTEDEILGYCDHGESRNQGVICIYQQQ